MHNPKVSLELDFLPGLSYLLFHAHIPVIRKIKVSNLSEEVLSGLTLEVVPSEEFSSPFEVGLEEIAGGQSIELNDLRAIAS
ncbi:hypothetical protein [Algoriphagus boritolerans]|uniref:Uncharacterized protein n=1 Tax=Algoriphagus boritolerans DSM 17298 = JCM 18970 TaxID=1120964 RepID=A0A1H5WJL3_9BACT|nr:hypothetical protein [Algoriphagus boritolerans]SEF99555.1 hypothetical protein SAMN03080598_02097 [Algoriphagus boritolerans DSM 17298 = JCM 18970]